MPNKTSQHILSTAANLLGFCLIVVTSLHVTNTAATSIIDEFSSIVALLLSLSCLLSFASIRTSKPDMEKKYESLAEWLFFSSLIGIMLIIVLLVFKFIQ